MGRLGKVDRRNVATLEMGQRHRQLGLERSDEITSCSGGRVSHSWATDKDDARSECVGANSSLTIVSLRAHWPRSRNAKSRSDDGGQKGIPSCRGNTCLAIVLRLPERVVDCYRKLRVRFFGEAVHRAGHAVEEEGLCSRLAIVTMGKRDKFLTLRYSKRSEELRENRLQRPTEPDVEIV